MSGAEGVARLCVELRSLMCCWRWLLQADSAEDKDRGGSEEQAFEEEQQTQDDREYDEEES